MGSEKLVTVPGTRQGKEFKPALVFSSLSTPENPENLDLFWEPQAVGREGSTEPTSSIALVAGIHRLLKSGNTYLRHKEKKHGATNTILIQIILKRQLEKSNYIE